MFPSQNKTLIQPHNVPISVTEETAVGLLTFSEFLVTSSQSPVKLLKL